MPRQIPAGAITEVGEQGMDARLVDWIVEHELDLAVFPGNRDVRLYVNRAELRAFWYLEPQREIITQKQSCETKN